MKSGQYMLTLVGATIFFCGQLSASGQIKRDTKEIQQKVKTLLNEIKKQTSATDFKEKEKKLYKYIAKQQKRNKEAKIKLKQNFFEQLKKNTVTPTILKEIEPSLLKNLKNVLKDTDQEQIKKNKKIYNIYVFGVEKLDKKRWNHWKNIILAAKKIPFFKKFNELLEEWENQGLGQGQQEAAKLKADYIINILDGIYKLEKAYLDYKLSELPKASKSLTKALKQVKKEHDEVINNIIEKIDEFTDVEKTSIEATEARFDDISNAITPLESVSKKMNKLEELYQNYDREDAPKSLTNLVEKIEKTIKNLEDKHIKLIL